MSSFINKTYKNTNFAYEMETHFSIFYFYFILGR